ncbi:MAG: NifB/NifX family molybdenum-iron cluster-binding protein [Patescibacteria group bacterium]
MKICITSTGKDLQSLVSSRFGRCSYFLIIDAETKDVEVVENTNVQASRGAGVAASQDIVNSGCDVVISGNIGPNAFSVLNQSGVDVFMARKNVSCEENLQAYNQDSLERATAESARGDGFGRGRRQGRGGGRRGGRS